MSVPRRGTVPSGREETSMRHRLTHLSLTTAFAVVSLIAFLVLGLVLSLGMNKLLHEQGLSDAKQTAQVVTYLGVEHNFPTAGADLFAQPLTPKQARVID